MQLREFAPASDRQAVERCLEELQEFSRAHDGRMSSGTAISAEYVTRLLRQCAECRGRVFVAEAEGAIVGYVCVLAHAPAEEPADGLSSEAKVIDLVVTEAARGMGVGRRLLEAAESFARSEGAVWLRVQVFAWNQAARRLYANHGFSEFEVTLEKSLRGAKAGDA
jgi:GNAT superfamily N-acetyltransferase